MRPLVLLVAALAVVAACSDDGDASPTTTVLATTTTRVLGPDDPPDPCKLLTAADFASVGVTLELPGEDLSDQLTLATDSSLACHWMGTEGELQGNWELLIGKGHAKEAFEFDYGFIALDGIEDLELGDDAFLSDRVDAATPEDYDFETGVLLGDLYFTFSTTEDDGREATIELTQLIVERLAESG
jgi:hypothetical protein